MEVEAEKHKNLGNAAFGDRNYEAAVHAYSAGLRCLQSLKSTSARDLRASLLHNRSLCYTQLKDQESALRDAQHALLCRPTWTKALYRLAEVKQNSGDVEGAITTLKSLLKLVTEDAKRKRALEKRLKKLQIQFELQRKQEESGGAASAAPRLQPDGKTPAARTANDEGMGVDEEAEPEEEVEEVLVDLGFVEEGLEAGWRIWDQGKCGGKPEFLVSERSVHVFHWVRGTATLFHTGETGTCADVNNLGFAVLSPLACCRVCMREDASGHAKAMHDL